MSISTESDTPEPVAARVVRGRLIVDLADGRTISVPVEWYPRLAHGKRSEWRNLRLSYAGIHWPDLDEDISVEGLLAGLKSSESPRSLRRWLNYRARGLKVPIPELPLPSNIRQALEKHLAAEQKKQSNGKRRRAG
jgi:hypothetical protein